MPKARRRHSDEFKFKVALKAAKGQKTVNEIASEASLHLNLVSQWKQEVLEAGDHVFRQPGIKPEREHEALQAELYQQIGRLKMELEGLKKKLPDQVWSADITSIPMVRGFMYLVAILDWFSRYVITWQLSNLSNACGRRSSMSISI